MRGPELGGNRFSVQWFRLQTRTIPSNWITLLRNLLKKATMQRPMRVLFRL